MDYKLGHGQGRFGQCNGPHEHKQRGQSLLAKYIMTKAIRTRATRVRPGFFTQARYGFSL